MVKKTPRKVRRNVTYTLPERVASELPTFYFAAQDKRALAAVYDEVARDPLFQADNETVLADFDALDREVEESRAASV